MRLYYNCSNFRNKGSSVCRANSLSKDYAEQEVFSRIQRVLSRSSILKHIVKEINQRNKTKIKPLQQELLQIEQSLDRIEDKKSKYFDLYEIDQMDKSLFTNRIEELNEEKDQLLKKQLDIQDKLKDDNPEPITYECVKNLILRFHELLKASPLEQQKTLMQLVIKNITVNGRKEIEDIQLNFDDKIENHFLDLAPSELSEGARFIQNQN